MKIIENGLYNIKQQYFTDFHSEFMVDNKSENRPFYFTFKDNQGLFWLIPLSTQTKSYKKKIKKDEIKHGNCLFYHIGKIAGVERVFLIGNMFPVTPNYIKKPYTISNTHYIVADSNLIKDITKKAKKYLALVENGKLKPNLDIMHIKSLLSHQHNN